MLGAVDFIKCMKGNLSDMGFGEKRIKELVLEFESIARRLEVDGVQAGDAKLLASDELFSRLSFVAVEKSKRTAKMLDIQANSITLLDEVRAKALDGEIITGRGLGDGAKKGVGTALARAAVSLIEHDSRFGTVAYDSKRLNYRNAYWSMFDEAIGKITKGFAGRQKGKAHLDNLIREIKGESTGDEAAAAIAKSWSKVSDYTVDSFNLAGGSMRKIANYLPQRQSMAKIHKGGVQKFIDLHLEHVDWQVTRWPDGNEITPSQRENFLREVYNTKVTDGAAKLDDKAFRGQGGAVGNALQQSRLIHYKDATAWLKMHETYGDGNVFDVLSGHLDTMAHQVAAVSTFGPNPELTAMNLRAMVKKRAAQEGPEELINAERVLKNKFNPMFDTAMRKNPMDPNSKTSATVSAVVSVLQSAQLGSAFIPAIGGDLNTTVNVRRMNNMKPFKGLGVYLDGLLLDPLKDAGAVLGVYKGEKFQRDLARESGFALDQITASNTARERFTGLTTHAPHIAAKLGDGMMRLSTLSNHTAMLRWANQKELMDVFRRSMTVKFDELPLVHVMERYGITAQDWRDFTGKVKPFKDRRIKNTEGMLRPLDILDTNLPNKQALFDKFQAMVLEESRGMVPDSTLEASVALKSTSRLDTMPGILLNSFAMYKNFPVTFHMKYSRLAMTSNNAKGRVGTIAGVIAGATFMGALSVQMSEISKGRDPLPMNTPEFLGKAMAKGGGLSVYGDFLFSGVNEFGRGPEDVFAGSMVGFAGDTTQLAFGDTLGFLGGLGGDEQFESDFKQRLVQYAKRYTPGSSLWWARLQLDRQIWDRLEELADPQVYQKRRKRERTREEKYGNESWFPAGERAPERAPSFGE